MSLTKFGDVMIDLEAVTFARLRRPDGNSLEVVIDGAAMHFATGDADSLSIWAALCERTAAPERRREDDEAAVVRWLRETPEGATRTQIRKKCFAGHRSSDEMDRLIGRLVEDGRIERVQDNAGEGFAGKGARWVLKDEPAS